MLMLKWRTIALSRACDAVMTLVLCYDCGLLGARISYNRTR